jgi:hypothetical protein
MNKYLFLVPSIVFLLVSCKFLEEKRSNDNTSNNNYGKVVNQTPSTDSLINDIPKELMVYVKTKLIGYRFPTTGEYNETWKRYKTNGLPFVCSSDFNGDGVIDYAAILVNENENEKGIALFAFNSESNSYKHFLIDNFSIANSSIGLVLSIQEKGEWEAIDEIINIENDGIVVDIIIESRTNTYYWNGEGFSRFFFD